MSQTLTIDALLREMTAADASGVGADFADALRALPEDTLERVLRQLRAAIRCGAADRRTLDTIVAAVAAT